MRLRAASLHWLTLQRGSLTLAVLFGRSRNPEELAYFRVTFDDEEYELFDTVIKDHETGFPKRVNYDGSEPEKAKGKNLLIQRREGELDDSVEIVLRQCLEDLRKAIDKFYAFGNIFAEEN